MLSTTGTIVNTQCTSLLVFDYPANYQIQLEDQIEVYYVNTAGNDNLLELTSDYEITDISETGFNVQLVTSYDEGIISIRRKTNLQQESEFIPGGDFPANVFEETLDKHMMAIQEIDEKASRAIRTHPSEASADLILPNAADRADKFIAFSEDGLEVIASEGSLSGPVENLIWDKLQFNADPPDPSSEPAGQLWWNKKDYALNIATGLGPVLQVGQESYVIVHNDTGSQIDNGLAVYPVGGFEGRPSVAKANALSHVKILGEVLITTMDIPDGQYGICTQFGKVRGIDTSSWPLGSTLWVSATVDGGLTNVRPAFPNYTIQVGGVTVSDADDGEIIVGIKGIPGDTVVNFWNGVFRETIDFLITSNGTVVTGSLSPANGHDDMTMIFNDGFSMLATNPAATIILVPGSNTVPVSNYVYIPKSTKVLTVSTSGWPAVEHIKVASVLLKTAAHTEDEGALKNQNWNDHIQDTTTKMGHLSHLGERIRQEHARWDIGIAGSVTIDSGPTPDDVFVAVASGYAYQMHRQFFPALDMETGDDIHVVNNLAAPYKTIGNLNTEILDANGDSLANASFSFVLWGVQNKTGQTSHLMLNLPIGKYQKNNPDSAVSDALNYSVYDIPKEFQGVGFLIARFIFVLETGGLVWTLHETQDLRGKIPNNIAGGGGGGGAETTAVPIGSVMPWTTSVAPVGYLICNGQTPSRTTYSDLFDIIGTTYGVGDGSTTFNVPKSDFDSGWIQRTTADWRNQEFIITHNLGVEPYDLQVDVWLADNDTPTNPVRIDSLQKEQGDSSSLSGIGIMPIDSSSFKLQTGKSGINYMDDSGVVKFLGSSATGAYRVIVKRKDFPKGSIIRATNTSVTLENVTSATIADLIVTNSATFQALAVAEQGITVPILHIQHIENLNVGGGTFTSGSWQTRTLNTERTNTIIGASLSTNQITLPAGTYKIVASAPAYRVDRHKIRIRNVTDDSNIGKGTSEFADATDSGGDNVNIQTRSLATIIFTLVAEKDIELQHYCETTKTVNGFGIDANFEAGTELYADVFIEKIG